MLHFYFLFKEVRSSVMEEQRKLAEERYEIASERYRLESMLKLDTDSTGTNLIQAKVEVKESFKELKKKEKEFEKRMEIVKELEKQLSAEKHKLQEKDDEIKIKSIRAEKMLKVNCISHYNLYSFYLIFIIFINFHTLFIIINYICLLIGEYICYICI